MATKAAVTALDHDHDHDHDHSEDEGSLTTIMKLKIVMIVLLFFIVYLGLIPAYSKYFRSSKVFLSLMNSFAGGVFLAMAFIHILPESVEQYNDAMKEVEEEPAAMAAGNSTASADAHDDHEEHGAHVFPLPYLLFFVGYMMVLLIDRVFAGEHGHSHGNQGGHSDHNHHDHEHKDLAQTDKKLVISPDNEKNTLSPRKQGEDLNIRPMVIQDIDNDWD
jgi:zinc transporter ZupT